MFKVTKDAVKVANEYKEGNPTRKALDKQRSVAAKVFLILFAIVDILTSPVRTAIVCIFEMLVMLVLVPVGKKKDFSRLMFIDVLPSQFRANFWTNLDLITYGSFASIRNKAEIAVNEYADNMLKYEQL